MTQSLGSIVNGYITTHVVAVLLSQLTPTIATRWNHPSCASRYSQTTIYSYTVASFKNNAQTNAKVYIQHFHVVGGLVKVAAAVAIDRIFTPI